MSLLSYANTGTATANTAPGVVTRVERAPTYDTIRSRGLGGVEYINAGEAEYHFSVDFDCTKDSKALLQRCYRTWATQVFTGSKWALGDKDNSRAYAYAAPWCDSFEVSISRGGVLQATTSWVDVNETEAAIGGGAAVAPAGGTMVWYDGSVSIGGPSTYKVQTARLRVNNNPQFEGDCDAKVASSERLPSSAWAAWEEHEVSVECLAPPTANDEFKLDSPTLYAVVLVAVDHETVPTTMTFTYTNLQLTGAQQLSLTPDGKSRWALTFTGKVGCLAIT